MDRLGKPGGYVRWLARGSESLALRLLSVKLLGWTKSNDQIGILCGKMSGTEIPFGGHFPGGGRPRQTPQWAGSNALTGTASRKSAVMSSSSAGMRARAA